MMHSVFEYNVCCVLSMPVSSGWVMKLHCDTQYASQYLFFDILPRYQY